MCDYSLMSLPNRLAAEGEELVVHRFPTGSMGFTSVLGLCQYMESRRAASLWQRFMGCFIEGCSVPAVCIPPAARLLLRNVAADLRRKHGLEADEEVRFVQLSAEPNTYRDAICFRNGAVLLLQDLPPGQAAKVLDLGESREEVPAEFGSLLNSY